MVTEIIGTPFKSRDRVIMRNLNKRNRNLAADVRLNKQNIFNRNVRDTIQAKGLPRSVRPGAIE